MENEILAIGILVVGLVIAAVVHFIIASASKTKSAYQKEETDETNRVEIVEPKIEKLSTSNTRVSLGIWEGVKFGIGLSIGFFLMSAFLGLMFTATFVKMMEGLLKSNMFFGS